MTTSNQKVRKKRNEAKTPKKAIDPQKALREAIEQIPVDGGRQKLLVFADVALTHVYNLAWINGVDCPTQVEFESKNVWVFFSKRDGNNEWVCPAVVKRGALGFKSTDGLAIPATGWSRTVIAAYMAAVAAKGPFGDVLAEIHQSMIGNGIKRLAQHFTPEHLADSIARFHEIPDPQPEGISLTDPTCGVGGMLLAVLRRWHKEGRLQSICNARVYLNDIDPLCCALASLQFLTSQIVFNAPLDLVQVTRGDVIAEYNSLELAFLTLVVSELIPRGEVVAFSERLREECLLIYQKNTLGSWKNSRLLV